MYEWAKNKPEYEEEKERYRQLKSNYSEDTIEKLAFFKWSSKVCSKKLFKKIQKGILLIKMPLTPMYLNIFYLISA